MIVKKSLTTTLVVLFKSETIGEVLVGTDKFKKGEMVLDFKPYTDNEIWTTYKGDINSVETLLNKRFPDNKRESIIKKLEGLGVIPLKGGVCKVRSHNIGNSNYADFILQPWAIQLERNLNYFDGDILKRVLRSKKGDTRKMDYQKIKHICDERIRQIDMELE